MKAVPEHRASVGGFNTSDSSQLITLDHVRLLRLPYSSQYRYISTEINGSDFYLTRQFEDPKYGALVDKISRLLAAKMSREEVYAWFTAPHGWLNWSRPIDCLRDHDLVLEAAHMDAE